MAVLYVKAPSVMHSVLLLISYLLEGNFVQFCVGLQLCAKGTELWINMRTDIWISLGKIRQIHRLSKRQDV